MPTAGTASAVAGVIALVLLTVSVVLGVAVSQRRQLPASTRYGSRVLHERVSLFALALVVLHVLGAVAGAQLLVVFVPFVAGFWLGLGAISFDLLVALVVTSLLRRRIGRRAWRAVHWASYACWPTAELHSFGFGVRSGRLFDLAVACALAVLAAAIWRLTGDKIKRRPGPVYRESRG
jgi:methionine sulfoxide reductase heme-binding subunit